MASAWGVSWGNAWGDSWGAVAGEGVSGTIPEFVPPGEVGAPIGRRRRYLVEVSPGVEIEVDSLESAFSVMQQAEQSREAAAPDVAETVSVTTVRIDVPTRKINPKMSLIPPLGGIRRLF